MPLTQGQKIALYLAILSDSPIRRALAGSTPDNLQTNFLSAVAPYGVSTAPANLMLLYDASSPDNITEDNREVLAAMDAPYTPAGGPCPTVSEITTLFQTFP